MTETDHRLPTGVRPTRYRLELDIDPRGGRFAGSVEIDVIVDEPTSVVELHALDLDLPPHATLVDAEGRITARVTADPNTERCRIETDRPLAAGPATLALSFAAPLGNQLVGLYGSTYEAAGVTHHLAVTQFEATHARRCLPCWDEPAHKAVFEITVTVDADLTAVSNSPEVSRATTTDGRHRIVFAPTMVMSTYLVALVVGPLEITEAPPVTSTDGRSVPLRIVHPTGKGALTGFAVEVATFALAWFERYFDLPYPGDKLDLVAVPDFAFGAMENLGCVTFREVLLLIDPEQATRAELERVATVVAHEIAHMWFGDLVTMDWWEGIWLNEAFATFMETSCTDAFRPDWDLWTSFGLARSAAFDTDMLRSTRAIEYPVHSPEEAEGMFDVLTYEKGGSVLRMLEQYLGPEVFREGVRRYLRRHAYGNTVTSDLWDALEEVAPEVPVRTLMNAWILTPGHPLLTVEPEGDRTRVRVSRMAAAGPSGGSIGDDPVAPVPVLWRSGQHAGVDGRSLIDNEGVIDDPAPLLNAGGSGFYRVSYAPAVRAGLPPFESLTALERYVLLDDVWAALVAGRADRAEVESVIAALLPAETSAPVWRRAAAALGELWRLDPGDRTRIEEVARSVGLPIPPAEGDESFREIRGIRLTLAGRLGNDAATVAHCARIDDDPTAAADPFEAAVAAEVVAPGADPARYANFEARIAAAATPQEELRLLNLLADVDDPDLFARTLEASATTVRTQNAPYVLRRALTHPQNGATAWAFVADRWSELLERFPSNSIPRMLEGIRTTTDPALAASIEGFLSEQDLGLPVRQHLERMNVNVQLAARLTGARS